MFLFPAKTHAGGCTLSKGTSQSHFFWACPGRIDRESQARAGTPSSHPLEHARHPMTPPSLALYRRGQQTPQDSPIRENTDGKTTQSRIIAEQTNPVVCSSPPPPRRSTTTHVRHRLGGAPHHPPRGPSATNKSRPHASSRRRGTVSYHRKPPRPGYLAPAPCPHHTRLPRRGGCAGRSRRRVGPANCRRTRWRFPGEKGGDGERRGRTRVARVESSRSHSFPQRLPSCGRPKIKTHHDWFSNPEKALPPSAPHGDETCTLGFRVQPSPSPPPRSPQGAPPPPSPPTSSSAGGESLIFAWPEGPYIAEKKKKGPVPGLVPWQRSGMGDMKSCVKEGRGPGARHAGGALPS